MPALPWPHADLVEPLRVVVKYHGRALEPRQLVDVLLYVVEQVSLHYRFQCFYVVLRGQPVRYYYVALRKRVRIELVRLLRRQDEGNAGLPAFLYYFSENLCRRRFPFMWQEIMRLVYDQPRHRY